MQEVVKDPLHEKNLNLPHSLNISPHIALSQLSREIFVSFPILKIWKNLIPVV